MYFASSARENNMELKAEWPRWSEFLFRPSRFKVAYGGRGSSKSWSFARALIARAYTGKHRILCAREFQSSISESVHQLLSSQIAEMGLAPWFEIQSQSIRCLLTGSEFFFYGLRSNITKVKSTEGITLCWIEEAEKISDESWKVLTPTVRNPGSEIWVTFNPDEILDPSYQLFVTNPVPDCVARRVNWEMNPWFPPELAREKDYLYRVDPEAASWVWGGVPRTNRSSQIFRGKYVVDSFTPPPNDRTQGPCWGGPYFGIDWGFSQDPTVLIRCWIAGAQPGVTRGRLMIEHEAYAIGCEIRDTVKLFDTVPGVRSHVLRADNARPETISHVKSEGALRIEPVEKWKGSVEDGVNYLRSFEEIVIHPRCQHTLEEARLYSYKVDRLTHDVMPDIVDRHNHCWDAVRYSLEPLIRGSTSLGVWGRLQA
jgi:phage terminase large subunit